MVRRVLHRFLDREKYDVHEAGDADSALLTFHAKGPFDALLCDVVLGRDDGWELAAKIYIAQPSIVVMMMSGYVVHDSIPPVLRHYRMLFKPFTPTELRRELAELWESMSSI